MTRLAKAAKEYGDSACVQQVVEFMRVEQKSGLLLPAINNHGCVKGR